MAALFLNCQGEPKPIERSASHSSSNASTLQGEWTSGCMADPQKAGFYYEDTRSFSGKEFSTGFDTYTDASCKNLAISHAQTGQFEILPASPKEENAPAKLNLTVKKIFITIVSQKLVDAYNREKVCGGGWVASAQKQMLKSECSGDANAENSDDLIFDAFRIVSTNGKESLHFGAKIGDSTKGNSEATRPSEIDPAKSFTRQ